MICCFSERSANNESDCKQETLKEAKIASHLSLSRRGGSFDFDEDVFGSMKDIRGRINLTVKKIRKLMKPTVKSIEGSVYKLNRDRVIIGMANWMASKKQTPFNIFVFFTFLIGIDMLKVYFSLKTNFIAECKGFH
jgi:hypothetical protein